MEFNQLRSFVAVAKLGHITWAAEQLHLSQPAISAQIKALEDQLGITLFERSSSGMALTPVGIRLLPEAERIVGAVQQFWQAGRSLRGVVAAKVRLGTVIDPAVLRVGELLARAVERFPLLEIELRQVLSSQVIAEVRERSLDGSFYFGPAPPEGIEGIPLRGIRYVVAVPAAWGPELGAMDWDSLAARAWIVAPEDTTHNLLTTELFRDCARRPERVVEADNEFVITNLIESGVGASIVREEVALASQAAGRMAVWPGAAIETRLWFVVRSDRIGDSAVDAVVAVLRELWPAADAGRAIPA